MDIVLAPAGTEAPVKEYTPQEEKKILEKRKKTIFRREFFLSLKQLLADGMLKIFVKAV